MLRSRGLERRRIEYIIIYIGPGKFDEIYPVRVVARVSDR